MHYYTLDEANAVCGPYDAQQVLELWQTGAVLPNTGAAVAGDSVWQPLEGLLPLIREDATTRTRPLEDAHFHRHVRSAMESGPPTAPELLKLLKEDAAFPRPRKPRP